MSTIKDLNITTLPKLTNNDPVIKRRAKLIAQLEQQFALAKDPMYFVTTQKWKKQEDGSKQLVDKQKRVKKWWVVDMMGNCFFTVRYGSKMIEFEKGKAAILVDGIDGLPEIINAVITLVKTGGLDTQLGSIQRVGQKPLKKAA